MIKLVMVVRRRDDLPEDEFHRYWREQHGPLARELLTSLGARRYVQTHTLGSELNAPLAESRGTSEAYDGLAEVWWDSLEALAAAVGTEQGQAANARLVEDEARFIDLARSSIFLTEEHAFIGD